MTSSECSSTSEQLSPGSLAVVNSIRESGEDVKVIRNIHTVVDTGELQLLQACCSAEVQTDFEPTWCFQNTPISVSHESRSEEITVNSAVVPLEDSRVIDLRNCDEFSIVHLEDVRDRSSQFMMLQTGSAGEVLATSADDTVHCLPVCNLGAESESEAAALAHVPVEIVDAPAMFVGGGGGQWKRQLELSTEAEGLRQPAEVDSGIWDMMQALGNVADVDSARSDLLHVSSEREGYAKAEADRSLSLPVVQPSLQGVYKMFQIADGAGSTESDASDAQVLTNSSNSVARSGIRQNNVGGLEDALEPVAVVDFVVHRVEAETVRMERVDLLEPARGQLQPQKINQTVRSNIKTERTKNQHKPMVNSATDVDRNADYSDGSCEDDESVHGSHEVTAVSVRRSDLPAIQTSDSATNTPRMKKKHKDVVRVTSARFGRSLRRRVGNKGRTSWKDPNSEARKSVSADVSRSSSLLDIGDGHQEMLRSSEIYSDPSPEHGECQNVKTASQSSQPFTSSPYGWRRLGPAGVESHEFFTDGSSSTASGPMTSGLGLFAEPDLLNFEKFPDWMRDLPEALLHVPLSNICIPGSHIAVAIERDLRTDLDFSKCNHEMADFLRKLPDLALFNNFRALMKTIWKAWMPKQCLSIYDQLVAGARYLDMRVTKLGSQFHGEHGLYSWPLKAYLRDVRRFVEEHTSEVVILHFQGLEFLDRADKRQLVTTLFQAFGARMACSSMLTPFAGSPLPSLKQLRCSEKQVVIFFPSSDMEDIRNHIFGGLVWSDEIITVVASPKTQTVAELTSALDATLASSRTPSSKDCPAKPMNVVKAVLSPDMSMVFGRYEYRSMRELVTHEASPAVARWVERKVGLNVVAVDFIGVGDVVRRLLQLNASRT